MLDALRTLVLLMVLGLSDVGHSRPGEISTQSIAESLTK